VTGAFRHTIHDQPAIRAHVQAINACNQRGGRMLSLVDLVAADSVDLAMAAYLAAAMRGSSSLLVGARPGGAGKTAVMCALLTFLPDHTAIRVVDRPSVLASGVQDSRVGEACYLAHEIGGGSWYAYVWGHQARAFFRLAAQGHCIASNLHADSLEETLDQLHIENDIPLAHLNAVTLKVYLRMERGGGQGVRRWVHQVYESDGRQDHLLWTKERAGVSVRHGESSRVSTEQESLYGEFLSDLLRRGVYHIEQIRRFLTHL
jgi:hypothetical protein